MARRVTSGAREVGDAETLAVRAGSHAGRALEQAVEEGGVLVADAPADLVHGGVGALQPALSAEDLPVAVVPVPGGAVLLVEPFAHDRIEDNLTPVAQLYYTGSTPLCCAHPISEGGKLVLGAQAGEARLAEAFNLIFEVRQ
jgi:hypothetical protein